jgi:hypothetical protein
MDVQCNTVARYLNHCCNGNTTMPSLCTVQLHVTVNNIKILNSTHKKIYGEFVSPATFGPNLTKSEFPRRIFLEVPSIKFHGNPSNESRADTCVQTDRQTDRYADVNKCFFCDYANARNKEISVIVIWNAGSTGVI